MRLAISGQLLARTRPLPAILDILHTLDVDAIELWPANLVGGETDEEQWRYERKALTGARQALASAGVAVACVTLGANIMRLCAERGAEYGAGALRGAVDAAAVFGAPLVNCYLAGLAPATFVAAARPAAEYAQRAGVTIVLENEAHDDSGPAASVRAIVAAVGSPAFGTLYDPCNYYQANEEPYPAAYAVLKDCIRYVHLKGGCQYDPGQPALQRGGTLRGSAERYIGYTPLPCGAINTDGILRRLAADGYQGFVTLEPHVPADQALDYYRIEAPYVRAHLDQLAALALAPA